MTHSILCWRRWDVCTLTMQAFFDVRFDVLGCMVDGSRLCHPGPWPMTLRNKDGRIHSTQGLRGNGSMILIGQFQLPKLCSWFRDGTFPATVDLLANL